MSKYIINIIFLLIFINVAGQQKTDSLQVVNDTVNIKKPVKIRFGFDIGNYIWAKLNNSEAYNFYADANFYKDYYLVVSGGYEKHLFDNNLLNFHTTGSFYKIGFAYNLYRNWLDMDNDITIGLNYAFASYDYLLHWYRINQPGAVFTPEIIEVEQAFNKNSAQWFELTAQVQVETFKNIYLGYNVAVKYLTYTSDIEGFTTIYIPGFNNKNTYSNFGFGMQYFISYRIKF